MSEVYSIIGEHEIDPATDRLYSCDQLSYELGLDRHTVEMWMLKGIEDTAGNLIRLAYIEIPSDRHSEHQHTKRTTRRAFAKFVEAWQGKDIVQTGTNSWTSGTAVRSDRQRWKRSSAERQEATA